MDFVTFLWQCSWNSYTTITFLFVTNYICKVISPTLVISTVLHPANDGSCSAWEVCRLHSRVSAAHLLLGLQALRVDPPHVVGFRADVIVPIVFDKVYAGVVCSLCLSDWSQAGEYIEFQPNSHKLCHPFCHPAAHDSNWCLPYRKKPSLSCVLHTLLKTQYNGTQALNRLEQLAVQWTTSGQRKTSKTDTTVWVCECEFALQHYGPAAYTYTYKSTE